jgi:serine/threonine protein kinase
MMAYTPEYASFEMINALKPDVRDDIYALSCIAYELFSGEHPYLREPVLGELLNHAAIGV